jgi:hypothetical protein
MGIASTIARAVGAVVDSVIGRPTAVPSHLITRYPELARARWRTGGLPVRVGGWCLGQSTVSAITLWRTIWLAPGMTPSEELLLHELRHVGQFEESALFPILYLWESVRRGYVANRFEVDARAYATTRLRESRVSGSSSTPRG